MRKFVITKRLCKVIIIIPEWKYESTFVQSHWINFSYSSTSISIFPVVSSNDGKFLLKLKKNFQKFSFQWISSKNVNFPLIWPYKLWKRFLRSDALMPFMCLLSNIWKVPISKCLEYWVPKLKPNVESLKEK